MLIEQFLSMTVARNPRLVSAKMGEMASGMHESGIFCFETEYSYGTNN
jgi:hypothetical protein